MIEKCEAMVEMGATEIRVTPREVQDLVREVTERHAHEARWAPDGAPPHPRSAEPGFVGTFKGVPLFRVQP